MTRIVRTVVEYQVRDAVRSRWLAIYAAFFLVASEALFRYAGSAEKAVVSLMTVVLFVVPLVTLVLGTVYLYGAREFTELLLAQPVRRGQLFAGLYLGLTLPLVAAFLGGVGIPGLLHVSELDSARGAFVTLLVVGAALTALFTAIAFVIALESDDRLRGLGIGIGVWLLLSFVYDGLVLIGVAVFADYPLERPMLALTFANPIDLGRVLLLLRLDVSALMGYTGAVFQRFFGGPLGVAAAGAALVAWIAAPVALGARSFARKDF